MTRKRGSFFIRSEGANEEAFKLGLGWLVQLVEKDLAKRRARLAICTKRNLQGVIEDVLGGSSIRMLGKGESVTLNEKVEVTLLTERERIYSWPGPILAAFPSKRLLDAIDALYDTTDVLVVPWTIGEVQYWIDTWGAAEFPSGTRPASMLALDPVLQEALRSLTETVNLSTGISHPSDRAAAIGAFRALHGAGIRFDATTVRAWLVAEGKWNPRDADGVMEIAKKVSEGKRVHGERPSWNTDIVKIWRERAAKQGTGSVE